MTPVIPGWSHSLNSTFITRGSSYREMSMILLHYLGTVNFNILNNTNRLEIIHKPSIHFYITWCSCRLTENDGRDEWCRKCLHFRSIRVHSCFSGVRVARSLVSCIDSVLSTIVFFFFRFFWSLYCLSGENETAIYRQWFAI
jgi:hypothetical protein